MRFNEILLELTEKTKNILKDKFKKTNPDLSDSEINEYLNKWDRFSNSFDPKYRDITQLSFEQIKKLIDEAETKSMLKGRQTSKKFNPQNDLIYNKNNLTILKGDLKEKCIQYGKGYTWCISRQDASNMFFTYRMRLNEPMFYFVFDKDKPKEDDWHAIVIYVDNENTYHVATSKNTGDIKLTWEEIVQKNPKLKGLQNLFKHQPLNTQERQDYEKYGEEVNFETYKNYNLKEKYKYIQYGHVLSPEQQDITPNELIGVYAKQLPTEITKKTLNRLKQGDLKKVISTIIDETNETEAHRFASNVLETPWHKTNLPDNIIQKAHNKIKNKENHLLNYTRYILYYENYNIKKIPEDILKSFEEKPKVSLDLITIILNSGDYDIDISEIPQELITGLSKHSGYSLTVSNEILDITDDVKQIPSELIKSIAKDPRYSKKLANELIFRKIEIPSILIDSISEKESYSAEIAIRIIHRTKDISKVPTPIMKTIIKIENPTDIKNFIVKIISNTEDIKQIPLIMLNKLIKMEDTEDLLQNIATNILEIKRSTEQIPTEIINKILNDNKISYYYAMDVIRYTKDITQVPQEIINNISKNQNNSINFALHVNKTTKNPNQIPNKILKQITKNKEQSYLYAIKIIKEKLNPNIIPKEIINKFKDDKVLYDNFKELIE